MSSLCYDLACTVAEKWVVGQQQDDEKNDFDFFKLMMADQMYRSIFLRLIKQNFRAYLALSLREFCFELAPLNRSPLAVDYNVNGEYKFGRTTKSKWMFLYLLWSNVLNNLSVHDKDFVMIRVSQIGGCQFSPRESHSESLMRLIFRKDVEFIKTNIGYFKHALSNLSLKNLSLYNTTYYVRHVSFPMIERCFNANSKLLYIDIHVDAGLYVHGLMVLSEMMEPRFLATCTENFQLYIDCNEGGIRCIERMRDTISWKTLLLYAVNACPNLEKIKLRLSLVVSVDLMDRFASAVNSVIEWIIANVLPRMHQHIVLFFRMYLRCDEGMEMNFTPNQPFSTDAEDHGDRVGDGKKLLIYDADPRLKIKWNILD